MDTDDREEVSSVPPGAARRSSNLIALATAAVLTVYAAGYARTKEAAARFDGAEAERRAALPDPSPPPIASARVASATPRSTPPRAAASATNQSTDSVPVPAPVTTAVVAAPAKTEPVVTKAPPAVSVTALLPKAAEPAAPVVPQPAPVSAPTLAAPPAALPTATPPAPAQQQPPKPKWNDGTYSGWGTSRHGDIQASVQIKDGEIVNAWISQCLTNYSCSWIDRLPPQVITRQSAEVDYVSGATQSANAFYYAILGALRAAK